LFTFRVKIIPAKYKIVLLACTLASFLACNKDNNENAPVWQITPEHVYSFVGKDWSAVKPTISNKKDYLYAEIPHQQVKAYVEVNSIDTAAPGKHYRLSFNVTTDNKIGPITLLFTDSMNQATGNKNFLYFYNHVALKLTNVTTQKQWVSEYYSPEQPITTDSLLVDVNAGADVQPYLDWYTSISRVNLIYLASMHAFQMYLSSY
jgi:hypothetical protein